MAESHSSHTQTNAQTQLINNMNEIKDRATPMLNDKVNEPISGEITPKLFNFNFHQCYDSTIDGQLEFFDVLNTSATIFLDKKAKILAWGTNIPRVETGVQLRMSTIPGMLYHVFVTGQLFLGNEVYLRIKNHNPVLYLNSDTTFKIGTDESKSFCFRALSHQTDLIMITPTDCFMPLAPFGFSLKYLTIIPDCFMCKGYIDGPTGLIGPVGSPGSRGNNGLIVQGPVGPDGPTGDQGETGPEGGEGPVGPVGPRGPIGPMGTPSSLTGPQGFAGPQGLTGFMGIIGSRGPEGPVGRVGATGPLGPANTVTGGTGLVGETGDIGLVGATGPTGPAVSDFELDQFTMDLMRGDPSPVAIVNVQYQRTGNMVTIDIPQFTAGSTGFIIPIVSDNSLPASIQPSTKNYILCTVIITGNEPPTPPTPTSCIIQIGPSLIIIYKGLVTQGFLGTDDVVFPRQSFTYFL